MSQSIWVPNGVVRGKSVDNQPSDLYLSIRGRLARAVTNIVPPGEVEDIVQETYVRACRASQASELRSPQSYMLRTAKSLALDHVKRAEYRLADSIVGRPAEQKPEGVICL